MPIGLALLFLTGVAPLLAWRKSTLSNLRYQFLWPVAASVASAVAIVALGIRVWTSGLCFVLCAFVTATIVQEFWRGAAVRKQGTGTDLLTALVGLVGRSKRRYGGYVVHLGIVLIFLGFAGEGFKQEEQLLLRPGQQATVGRYTVRLDAVRVTDDGQKQMVTGHLAVIEGGKEIGKAYPAKWFYRKHEEEPTTEVDIRRGPSEDLYIVMPAFDLKDQSASLHIVINPLVNWIWIGFGIMALGTGIALLPERAYSFAVAKLPADAVSTTTALLVAIVLLSGATARAQHVEPGQQVPIVTRSPLEREMQRNIICMCGTCGRQLLSECQCGTAVTMRAELAKLVSDGMDKDQIVQFYIAKYGSQEPLAQPIDKGFNRLAWAVPYMVGATSLVLVGVIAMRWSRRGATNGAEPVTAPGRTSDADTALEARLNDELSNLD
jgi:cytochrome c-type biogenesis protein CcmF